MEAHEISAAVQTVNRLNHGMGLVSFASILVMLHLDSYTFDWHPHSWVRIMVYLDALAFFIMYQADVVADVAGCQEFTYIRLWSDIIWSFKDYFKMGYIAYRALTILGSKRTYPIYWAAFGSLALYWFYIYDAYTFILRAGNHTCSLEGMNETPLVLLYSYWTLVEIGVSAMVVQKMAKVQQKVKQANFAVETYQRFKFKEEIRLLVACLGMGAVTAISIIDSFSGGISRRDIKVTRIVFVYAQLLLLLGSAAGDIRKDCDEEDDDDDDGEEEDGEWRRRSFDS
ncbi:hypothetical protein BC830DRAFT_1222193 [Chytriomyces sp. MP71]|nr:hypothetical protein BC830DRAFT_1222193 [Chytriomyces sp. MP71]